MVNVASPPVEPPEPPAESSVGSRRLEPRQFPPRSEMSAFLLRRLNALFPEPLSLDIVTAADVRRLYRFTGLGVPALAAMEQSRRILRSRSDSVQIGLGEFHAGLVYMDFDDCRAAATPFAEACARWALIDIPAVCLAHFAQGVALCYANHLEAAMKHFGQAERVFGQPPGGGQGERFSDLADALRPKLDHFQAVTRANLWPPDRKADEPPIGYLTVPPGNVIYGYPPRGGAAGARPDSAGDPRPGPGKSERTDTPGETTSGQAGGERDAGEDAAPADLPRAFSQVQFPADLPSGPVPMPGHAATDADYSWYQIVSRRDDFLPSIVIGAWALAYRDLEERAATGQRYVIVGSRQSALGSIAVRPILPAGGPAYYYLGYRVADSNRSITPQLYLDKSGLPVTASDAYVLAVVEGFWYDLGSVAAPAA